LHASVRAKSCTEICIKRPKKADEEHNEKGGEPRRYYISEIVECNTEDATVYKTENCKHGNGACSISSSASIYAMADAYSAPSNSVTV
jgi:uncharacterized protein YmfQ (DUF2313 family)